MSSLGTGTTGLQKQLIWFRDCIDISENIKRAERTASQHPNGLHAWIAAGSMLVLTIIMFVLAYKFDFESTYIGMSTLRDTVLEGLPASVLKFTVYIVIALTVAPTVIELFTSAFAKADIKIIQVLIIAFTGFDMITDIPRAMVFTNQLQANFDQLGALSFLAYWAFFLFWLFLSTIGFELVMVIFGFLTIVYLFKGLAGSGSPVRSSMKSGGGMNNGMPKQTVVDADGSEKVRVVM